jgi:hypothetical protein
MSVISAEFLALIPRRSLERFGAHLPANGKILWPGLDHV